MGHSRVPGRRQWAQGAGRGVGHALILGDNPSRRKGNLAFPGNTADEGFGGSRGRQPPEEDDGVGGRHTFGGGDRRRTSIHPRPERVLEGLDSAPR
jgi:hypothetical protein